MEDVEAVLDGVVWLVAILRESEREDLTGLVDREAHGVLFLDIELEVDCAWAGGCHAELEVGSESGRDGTERWDLTLSRSLRGSISIGP